LPPVTRGGIVECFRSPSDRPRRRPAPRALPGSSGGMPRMPRNGRDPSLQDRSRPSAADREPPAHVHPQPPARTSSATCSSGSWTAQPASHEMGRGARLSCWWSVLGERLRLPDLDGPGRRAHVRAGAPRCRGRNRAAEVATARPSRGAAAHDPNPHRAWRRRSRLPNRSSGSARSRARSARERSAAPAGSRGSPPAKLTSLARATKKHRRSSNRLAELELYTPLWSVRACVHEYSSGHSPRQAFPASLMRSAEGYVSLRERILR
jgi:hypothetical protein